MIRISPQIEDILHVLTQSITLVDHLNLIINNNNKKNFFLARNKTPKQLYIKKK